MEKPQTLDLEDFAVLKKKRKKPGKWQEEIELLAKKHR